MSQAALPANSNILAQIYSGKVARHILCNISMTQHCPKAAAALSAALHSAGPVGDNKGVNSLEKEEEQLKTADYGPQIDSTCSAIKEAFDGWGTDEDMWQCENCNGTVNDPDNTPLPASTTPRLANYK
eukprot:10954149-Ditylum_brightwellii.AAC.1